MFCHLVSFDCFRGQIDDELMAKLCYSAYLHHCATELRLFFLQHTDLGVNKSAKSFLKNEFENWYAAQVCEELNKRSKPHRSREKTVQINKHIDYIIT